MHDFYFCAVNRRKKYTKFSSPCTSIVILHETSVDTQNFNKYRFEAHDS